MYCVTPFCSVLKVIHLSYVCTYVSLHAAPSAPLNLTFAPGGVLNDSVTLTWLSPVHPSGVIQFYRLQWVYSGGVVSVNTTDNSTMTVLSNLVPGTQYNFSVRAFTVAFGPFSAALIIHTADGEDDAVPFVPHNCLSIL